MPDKPIMFVIFGVTGDLSRRKLLPALYHLTRSNLLPPKTKIIGITRQKLTKEEALAPLEKFARSHARISELALRRIKQNFELFNADLTKVEDYRQLLKHLNRVELKSGLSHQRLFYLSVPPAVVDEVVGFMGQAELHKPCYDGPKPAILIEKPFGYDLTSAKELIKSIKQYFNETQIYRIDHYLAKEMAQNILDFRFANPLFNSIWDHEHINKVVITAYENIGIEGRTRFYEQTGALRDLIQSHLLQLMALTAMEVPRSMTPDIIRSRRRELLESVTPPEPNRVGARARRGQYASYRKEVNNKNSLIETYAAVKLFIDQPRWKNVPFILRTGKAMHERRTDIAIHFSANVLKLQLQPEETISLRLNAKQPGHGHTTKPAIMDFDYKRSYPGTTSPEAYERVLLDAARQDQTLFASSEEVLAAWKIVQPILDEWSKSEEGLITYKNGARELPAELRIV